MRATRKKPVRVALHCKAVTEFYVKQHEFWDAQIFQFGKRTEQSANKVFCATFERQKQRREKVRYFYLNVKSYIIRLVVIFLKVFSLCIPLLEEPKVAQKLFMSEQQLHGLGNTYNVARFELHIAFGIKRRARLLKTSKLLARAFLLSMLSIASSCPIVLLACLTASSITQCSHLGLMLYLLVLVFQRVFGFSEIYIFAFYI